MLSLIQTTLLVFLGQARRLGPLLVLALSSHPSRPMTLARYLHWIDLALLLLAGVVSLHRHFLIEIIFWALQILIIKLQLLMAMQSACKSTQQHFNVHCAPNGSPVHTICARICGLIQMSVLSCVQFVVKHLLANTTGNGTKDCIQERRNSSARASLSKAASGAVAAVLLEQTLWAGISVLKLAEYA